MIGFIKERQGIRPPRSRPGRPWFGMPEPGHFPHWQDVHRHPSGSHEQLQVQLH